MRDFNKEIVLDPISEARRYVDNAHETLRENGKLNTEKTQHGNWLRLGQQNHRPM
jgi:hypothetical protein